MVNRKSLENQKHGSRKGSRLLLATAVAMSAFTTVAVTEKVVDAAYDVRSAVVVSSTGMKDMQGHWAAQAVADWMQQKQLISGYADGSFRPNDPISRAEFAVLLHRVFALKPQQGQLAFADVPAQAFYKEALQGIVPLGWMSGYADGTFQPSRPLTRQEAAVVLYKAFDLKRQHTDESVVDAAQDQAQHVLSHFLDRTEIAAWSTEAVAALVANNYISGYPDGTFSPQRQVTRAEAVALMQRITGEIYNRAGTYTGGDLSHVTVTAPDVALVNAQVGGNFYVTEGVAYGSLNLSDSTVAGDMRVGGSTNISILLENTLVERMIWDTGDDASHIRLRDKAVIRDLTVKSDLYVELDQGSLIGHLVVVGDAKVVLSGEGEVSYRQFPHGKTPIVDERASVAPGEDNVKPEPGITPPAVAPVAPPATAPVAPPVVAPVPTIPVAPPIGSTPSEPVLTPPTNTPDPYSKRGVIAAYADQMSSYDSAYATYYGYGDEAVSTARLQQYDELMQQRVIPEVERLFPTFEWREVDKPTILLLTMRDDWETRWDDAWFMPFNRFNYSGIYSSDENMIVLTEKGEQIGRNNLILTAHEYMHWVVQQIVSNGHIPSWMNEGLAYHFSWSLYENQLPWQSSLTQRAWDRVAQSEGEVPDLWEIGGYDANWAMTGMAFLMKNYDMQTLYAFIARSSEWGGAESAFEEVFAISRADFQQQFEEEVAARRAAQ